MQKYVGMQIGFAPIYIFEIYRWRQHVHKYMQHVQIHFPVSPVTVYTQLKSLGSKDKWLPLILLKFVGLDNNAGTKDKKPIC